MKNQIISTSCTRNLCLMTFILLFSLFTSNNAFSIKWQHHHMSVNYFSEENAIDIKFIFYENAPDLPNLQSYMRKFEILYTTDEYNFTPLLAGVSLTQSTQDNKRCISVTNNTDDKNIKFVNGKKDPGSSKIWFPIKNGDYKEGKILKKSVYSSINFKWISSKAKHVKAIKIKGVWKSGDYTPFEETYEL